ncbi:PAS domain-containing protein [Hyphococcus sp.]|uniref:PAS domain-containing protein n=1 Tax=Hyphococcus sp. TaxID=2038636 RepID=UPI0035C72B16
MKRPLPSDDIILTSDNASVDTPVADEESRFGFDELFFSRTDSGGVIKYGNSVFQRVSAYDWEELLGKPHKIIRHPDTPRAVFWLLWETIKKGEPIGAYVKNRAKDGRYYWVFALVTPVRNGYLSVRLRPSSDYFDIVQKLYEDLAEKERRETLAPADSAALLLAKLKELGFKDYPAFMTAALGKELISRDRHLKNIQDPVIFKFDELLKVTQSLLREAESIARAHEENKIVPTNFRILASRLGQSGDTIAVISDNYSLLSDDMNKIVEGFISSAQDVVDSIITSYFLAGTARVQLEMSEFFQKEEASSSQSMLEAEIQIFNSQRGEHALKVRQSLGEVSKRCSGFRRTCVELERITTGLEVMRVVGKVECSNHSSVKDRADDLLAKLETFQRTVTGALKSLTHMHGLIQQETDNLRRHAEKAA